MLWEFPLQNYQKFVITRKSVKNWNKIITMKLEAVVFEVFRVTTINCKSTMPGLTSIIDYGAA